MMRMYDWLDQAISRVIGIGYEYSVRYNFILNSPATPDEIKETELRIGYLLPQSYKEFLMKYDGARLFVREALDSDYVVILSLNKTKMTPHDCDLWQEETFNNPDEDKILLVGYIWTGEGHDWIGLDPYQTKEGDEWKVLYVYGEEKPSGLRRRPLASSFDQWIRRMFSTVLVREEDPLYWSFFYRWGGWTKDDVPPSIPINVLDRDDWFDNVLSKHSYNSTILEKMGNYEAALKEYESSFSEGVEGEDGGTIECRYRRGYLRSLVGDQKGALEDYSYAISYILDLSIGAWDVQNSRGWYVEDDDLCSGERYLNLIYPDAHYHRAQIRAEFGDIQGAIDDYQEAARVYKIKRQDQKAEDCIGRATQLKNLHSDLQ